MTQEGSIYRSMVTRRSRLAGRAHFGCGRASFGDAAGGIAIRRRFVDAETYVAGTLISIMVTYEEVRAYNAAQLGRVRRLGLERA